jgi:enoyl-CoA hydratase/carnithine racemase
MSERVALKKQNSAAVDAAERDPSVSAVVLIGGGRTFISGIDIKAVAFGTGGAGPELQAVLARGVAPAVDLCVSENR